MDRTYTVVLLSEDEVGGFSVVVPALPGCFSQGETVPEALEMAREAISCHLASLEKHGEQVPDDLVQVTFAWGDSQVAHAYKVTVAVGGAATLA
jgi:antitoxin HicB